MAIFCWWNWVESARGEVLQEANWTPFQEIIAKRRVMGWLLVTKTTYVPWYLWNLHQQLLPGRDLLPAESLTAGPRLG